MLDSMDLNTGLSIFGAVAALISIADLAYKYGAAFFKKIQI